MASAEWDKWAAMICVTNNTSMGATKAMRPDEVNPFSCKRKECSRAVEITAAEAAQILKRASQ